MWHLIVVLYVSDDYSLCAAVQVTCTILQYVPLVLQCVPLMLQYVPLVLQYVPLVLQVLWSTLQCCRQDCLLDACHSMKAINALPSGTTSNATQAPAEATSSRCQANVSVLTD